MAFRYERTLAPSEEVSNTAAKALGIDVEYPIWAHYLHETKADLLPGGVGILADFRDTGVPTDYIKILIERHQRHVPKLTQEALIADWRTGKFAVPDISTYRGRFVPPRIRADGSEDRARCEHYEIKPNSDDGEKDGILKFKDLHEFLRRHNLDQFYMAGITYPTVNPTYIPLVWGEVFEYMRLIFMWHNNLKECKVDLQVNRSPKPEARGLILYAFRITLEVDVELAMAKLKALAAGIAVALAICAVAGALELALDGAVISAAAGLLEFLKSLPLPEVPDVPVPPQTKFRVEEPRVRVAPESESVPNNLPDVEMEPDPIQPPEQVELPRRKRAIREAMLGRGYGLPGKTYDIYSDEDYFQNIILDRSSVEQFKAMARVPLPLSPALVAPAAALSAYGQFVTSPFVWISAPLIQSIEARLPNQVGAPLKEPIPAALRRLLGGTPPSEVTVLSHVLAATALLAAFIDPSLKANTRKRVPAPNRGLNRGRIVLPQKVLAAWTGRDASVGARATAETADDLKRVLLSAAPDEAYRSFLSDTLSDLSTLKFALNSAPGFTLAIGVHRLYRRFAGSPVTPQTRYGTAEGSQHVSRLFAVAAKEETRPPAIYANSSLKDTAADPSEVKEGSYRFIARVRLGR